MSPEAVKRTEVAVAAATASSPRGDGTDPTQAVRTRAAPAIPATTDVAALMSLLLEALKKAEKADAHVSEGLLKEPAEHALFAAMNDVTPQADAQFDAGNYTASLQTLAALRAPVDAFFENVMVNAEQADLRLNRLGLLATLHRAMNRVADLSRLAA